MRTVIDTNALQSARLRDYLARSPFNFVVLTDYLAMEVHKGNTLASVFKAMDTLAHFPKQVIVLKPTGVICGLQGRPRRMWRQMVDDSQTGGFEKYCVALIAAGLGEPSLRKQLLGLGSAATEHMNRILSDAPMMYESLEATAKMFTASELKVIRTRAALSKEIIEKVMGLVILLTHKLYEQHPNPPRVRKPEEMPYTYLYRSALCSLLWALDWISVGGPLALKPERMRNDLVDQHFAVSATYFDGLLSMDEKPMRLYRQTAFVLTAITSPPP